MNQNIIFDEFYKELYTSLSLYICIYIKKCRQKTDKKRGSLQKKYIFTEVLWLSQDYTGHFGVWQ